MCSTESSLQQEWKERKEIKRRNPAPHKTSVPQLDLSRKLTLEKLNGYNYIFLAFFLLKV